MSVGAAWTDPVGLAYIGVFAISGVACVIALSRAFAIDNREIRISILGLLGMTALWAFFKTAFFLLPGAFREATYTVGLVFGFGTVWAWLYFCSAYTGRAFHRNTKLRRIGTTVFVLVVSVKLTNPIHGLYFETSTVVTPFSHMAIEHGPLHWSATGLSYILAAVGLFMLFEFYADSGYNTNPLTVLTVLLGLPVVLDIVALVVPQLINVIYAPLGVAAFAIGALFVYDQRFLAVQSTADDDGATIFLDDTGLIRDSSPAARAAFPELEGATGESLSSVLPEVDAARTGEERVFERKEAEETRYYVVSTTDVSVGDSAVELVSFSDVTAIERQRRQLVKRERELDERNELYRAVIAASFALILRTDDEGYFNYVSQSVDDFLGYEPGELESKHISTVLPSKQMTQEAQSYLDEVAYGEALQISDFPLETKSGRVIYADVRAVPIYEASVPTDERTRDDIVGTQVMIRDAMPRRQREGLISVINRVLRHNVRNKLTVIRGHAEMLTERLDGEPEQQAARTVDAADRLLELTESARKIEKHRDVSPELESVDVAPLLRDNVEKLRKQYPGVSVTLDTPETAVAESLPRIETALWELFENAARHAGEAPTINVGVTETDHQVVITVADDGPGLPEAEREVLSTGTEEPLVHGDGLGLYLAYWVVNSLRGEIEVTEFEAGTTIELRLPKASTDNRAPRNESDQH